MPTPIRIKVGEVALKGELFDTDCAKSIAALLPITKRFNVWGDEFYFEIPYVCNRDETATSDVDVGTIAYWPVGRAIAIFFGPTPMSTGRKPVPADRVNIIGCTTDDATALRRAKGAAQIMMEKVE